MAKPIFEASERAKKRGLPAPVAFAAKKAGCRHR
jgi:hypothetical protein